MKILKNYKNSVDKTKKLYYINSVIENGKCGGIAQLARAIGSYPAGHKFKSYCRYQIWPHRQAVKTSPFHGEVSGSNPLGVTNLNQNRYTVLVFLLLKFAKKKRYAPASLFLFKICSPWSIARLLRLNLSSNLNCIYQRDTGCKQGT